MVEKANLEQKLCEEREQFVVMDSETFNQVSIGKELSGDRAAYVEIGMTIYKKF